MTYKQIETGREIRLWIGQIIIPAAGVTAMILNNPDVKKSASEKLKTLKQQFRKSKKIEPL